MGWLKGLLRVVDDYQQRHAWIGFPVAVVRKYGDDRGGHHAQFPVIGPDIRKTVAGSRLRGLARQEERFPDQRVEVTFGAGDDAEQRDADPRPSGQAG